MVGMLSFAGLLLVWEEGLNPLRVPGGLPRGAAGTILVILSVVSFLASLSGNWGWLALFATTVMTLAFVFFFYHPLF